MGWYPSFYLFSCSAWDVSAGFRGGSRLLQAMLNAMLKVEQEVPRVVNFRASEEIEIVVLEV